MMLRKFGDGLWVNESEIVGMEADALNLYLACGDVGFEPRIVFYLRGGGDARLRLPKVDSEGEALKVSGVWIANYVATRQ